ncbi:MAG: patatin-like phospholipase family protein [Lachnospiraceae bacterium]
MKVILSISGGGIRGLIPALILAKLESMTNLPIASSCDLIAGTSTGGIIAALLTTPNSQGQPKFSANEIVALYKTFGKKVFHQSLLRKFTTLDGLIGTKYSTAPLEKLLKSYFGTTKLSETTTNILIPAYQISHKPYPYFFKTLHAKQSGLRIENPDLWECARATSAANSYFKPYRMDKNRTFLDGGVFANTPAMCAYAQAKNLYGERESLVIISIGTGEDLIGYRYDKICNWGMLQWALPFFRQTSISSGETIDYMLRTFAVNGDHYFRLQSRLDKESLKMDDVSDRNLMALEEAANCTIMANASMLHTISNLLLKQHSTP